MLGMKVNLKLYQEQHGTTCYEEAVTRRGLQAATTVERINLYMVFVTTIFH
jgi:hypothetical protein